MEKGNKELIERLIRIAGLRSKPYCKTCLQITKFEFCTSVCTHKMGRYLPSIGLGPDLNWVLKELLVEYSGFEAEMQIDGMLDEHQERYVFGEIALTPSTMLRSLFPKCYQMLANHFDKKMRDEGLIIEVASELYWTDDVLTWLKINEPASALFH